MALGWVTERTEKARSEVGVPDRDTLDEVHSQRSRPRSPAERIRSARTDLIVAAGYLSLAVFVLSRLWLHPRSGYLIKSDQDQTLYEWFFALTAHKITHFEGLFSTTLQNYPDGVNLTSNTLMYGFGVPFTPVTLLFGPSVTFVLALTLGLSGTAFAWYRVFSRELVTSKFAAALGGLFCGFAPAMISHTNGHPNFVMLVLLPFIAMRVIKMARHAIDAPEAGTAPRDSIVLGLLVAMQITLGEEPLLIFALAFAVFALTYLRTRRAILLTLRAIARPVLLAALITLALITIPLWWQFFGPQSYRFVGRGRVGNDLLAPFQFSSQSAGSMFSFGPDVSINPTEHNSYFGWPLLLLLAVTTFFLWRERIVRAAFTTIMVFMTLSMGIVLFVGGTFTMVPMPWLIFGSIPPLNGIIESRFAMAAIPALAVIMALGTQRAIDHWRTSTTKWQPVAWFGALAFALLPIAPTILPVVERTPTPAFFADGTVRQYVSDGSVVIVPPSTPVDAIALRWQLDADFTFPLVGGYFVGPAGADKAAHYGAEARPTANQLTLVRMFNTVPAIDQATRDQAIADLRYWHADVVVLPPTRNSDALRRTMDQLLGFPAQQADGVLLWDVRSLV
ncbi:glycosyl transferase [Nocardia sp. SYP-A9097]|uniref:glycosyl transferase n=1 Tax=Nocardia sp. SYP-A9097 TaxID=2663237 RepID=UPI001325E954|nr:glycosyl transferase [Nocardia sp. SYP-A9097]MRH87957.1 glycosyl transferase [Nocardia sp. SYP-A9097]